MKTEIIRNVNDLISKYTVSLFKNTPLFAFYGIDAARVKEIISPEFQKVEVGEFKADMILLLEDDSYLHLEFQTTASYEDIYRFAHYDFLLYKRDRRKVRTIVIYTADVKEADSILNMGSLYYNTEQVMMINYDGNSIFKSIEDKINNQEELDDIDILNLIFIPLMKHEIRKKELALKSMELANNIKDVNKKNTCLASIYAFASKFLEGQDKQELLEVLKMSDLLVDYVVEEVRKGQEEEKIKIATNLLQMGYTIDKIAKATELDEDTILKIEAALL